MAEDPLSQQREHARVPRDYLSQPVHSSARSIEERADGPPAVEAAHAPFASCQRTWTLPGADRRCSLNSRATRGGRRPSDSRPLGRRSAGRWKEQLHCDVSGAAFTLPHADQGAEQRNGSGGCRLESACSETSGDAAPLADLGSRIGDGQAQSVYGCYRCAGLLLRSTKSLAAWHERKHQSAPAAILPARNRPSSHHSTAARPGRAALESTSKKDPGISNSSE